MLANVRGVDLGRKSYAGTFMHLAAQLTSPLQLLMQSCCDERVALGTAAESVADWATATAARPKAMVAEVNFILAVVVAEVEVEEEVVLGVVDRRGEVTERASVERDISQRARRGIYLLSERNEGEMYK